MLQTYARHFCGNFSKSFTNKRQAALKVFVTDAYNFALYFREIIEEHPLQLYYAGLAFSPTTSEVRIAFQGDLSSEIKVLHDSVKLGWPNRYIDIECNSPISALQYSHDGSKLAVAEVSGKIQFFDTISGEALQPVLFLPFDNMEDISPKKIGRKSRKDCFKSFPLDISILRTN